MGYKCQTLFWIFDGNRKIKPLTPFSKVFGLNIEIALTEYQIDVFRIGYRMGSASMKNWVEQKIKEVANFIIDSEPVDTLLSFLKKYPYPKLDVYKDLWIKIDKKWDSFPDPEGERKSFFTGRDKELDELRNWLVSSDGGSVLIKGFRGVGKTSFVYESLSEARDSSDNLIFIPVSFSEGDFSDDAKTVKRLILSLHYVKPNLCGLDRLYKIAISNPGTPEETEKEKQELTVTSYSKLAFSVVITTALLVARWNPFFSVLLSTVIYLGLSFVKSRERIVKINLENANYLIWELKKVIEENEINPVFVIDELDKLFGNERKNDGELRGIAEVNAIVKKLKYLFTLSQSRFVFIIHEKYPHWSRKIDSTRPEESTYFGWEIFLKGLIPDEIQRYLVKISHARFDADSERILQKFSYYVSFASQRIFSEASQVIRSHIEYKNNNQPYLVIRDFYKGDPWPNYARQAILESVIDNVLEQEERLEQTPKQRERYQNMYEFLNKVAKDFVDNRFLVGVGNLADKSLDELMVYYSTKMTNPNEDNTDYMPMLSDIGERMRIKSKLRLLFETMDAKIFGSPANKNGKVFFDKNWKDEDKLQSSLGFNDVVVGSLVEGKFVGIEPESLRFKESIFKFKDFLRKIMVGLDLKDETKAAQSLFGDKGLAFLNSLNIADKIDPDDQSTNYLSEIRKLESDNPGYYSNFEENWKILLKNWLIYSLPGCKYEEISTPRRKKIGFSIAYGGLTTYIILESTEYEFRDIVHGSARKPLAILINGAFLKRSKGITIPIDKDNLKGAQNLLELIREHSVKNYPKKFSGLTPGLQEQHFASFIDIPKEGGISQIDSISFTMHSQSNYWRAGFLLGQQLSDKYEPLGNVGFPLFHLHKDTDSPNLKLTTYREGKSPPDVFKKDLGIPATGDILFNLSLESNNEIQLSVNGKDVYTAPVDPVKMNKSSIVVWSDNNPEFKGVEIDNYSYSATS